MGSTVPKKLNIPAVWEASAKEIIENKLQKILIVGGVKLPASSWIVYFFKCFLEKIQTCRIDLIGEKRF